MLLLVFAIAGAGVMEAAVERDSVAVEFRQSRVNLDTAYKDNGLRLHGIVDKLERDTMIGRTRTLRRVSVVGAASPEGSVSFNKWLSERRADAIFDYFKERGLVADSLTSFQFLGRDWGGLQERVEADEAVPYREDVLALLQRVNGGSDRPAHPLAELKSLRGGIPYMYLYNNIFPELRKSQLMVEYAYRLEMPKYKPEPFTLDVNPAQVEPQLLNPAIPAMKDDKPFYMALKTNMLYDALLIPNIGAEFYVGKNWSVLADWMYGWWDKDATHYYWRCYGGYAGVRRWFGRLANEKPLTGHHIGVFGGAITYDFELGGQGIMGGRPHGSLWDRCNYVAGIEYGYSLPVARRLNIDFTIGLGYIGGRYLKYVPKHGFYQWQSTHNLHWVGPVKAEIALVWLIGHGNYNEKKGGSK